MDQLEIISPTGAVEFFALDPAKGVINIGRHSDNDLTVNDPQVAPYQLMLDYRQQPYHLMLLSQSGRVVVDGVEPPLHQWQPLSALTRLQVGSHTLLLVEDEAISPSPALVPERLRSETQPLPLAPPVRPGLALPPDSRPEPFQPSLPAALPAPVLPNGSGAGALLSSRGSGMGLLRTRPADEPDEVILTEISEQEWTINVDNVITTQIKITNAGELVARFYITVQGLDPEWVELSAPTIRVDKSRSDVVTITISPPRQPSSLAGPHHFAVQITSPQYPGRVSQHGATLTINPYYEFAVGELSPKRQAIPWRRHVGRALVPITNLGNSTTHFRLEGSDDEHACNYEFDVPGEPVALARQADLHLTPEESITVPISITPHTRRFIGLRKRLYAYTVTTNLVIEQPTSRSLLGELRSAPLIGPWILLLVTLLTMILLLILLRPRIYNFMLLDGGREANISNGTPVALRWDASFPTNLTLDPPIEGLEQPLASDGTAVAMPVGDVTYVLVGENMISRFAPAIFPAPTRLINVQVNAIPPRVVFEAQPAQIVGEGEVTLRWAVEQADKIELFRRVGDSGALESIGDFSDQPATSLIVTPEPNQNTTTYVLVASNLYAPTPTPVPQLVTLLTPTPTIPPTPAVIFFTGNPLTINEGQETTLTWQVAGPQEVTLQDPAGVPSIQPASHTLQVRPVESGDYTLIPRGGAQPRTVHIEVIPATATPVPPDAPVIEFFTASPDEVIKGERDDVTLAWSVTGETTNIEITGPDIGVISGLAAEGSLATSADEATLFILTAFNEDLKASRTVQLKDQEPTPTPEPTETPFPLANIIFFKADSGEEPPRPQEITQIAADTYEVLQGSRVKLSWSVQNATQVILEDFGTQPFDGNVTFVAAGSKTYRLTALNQDNKETNAFLKLEVNPLPPPPPPSNVNGQNSLTDSPPITLTWTYPGAFQDVIEGFRVYRANLSDGNFSRIVDEGDLGPTDNQFVDTTANPACGKIYYVVAVYVDIENEVRETDSSTTSWGTKPCPP